MLRGSYARRWANPFIHFIVLLYDIDRLRPGFGPTEGRQCALQ